MLIQDIQLHNLPSQPTPFIGREPEIAEIVDLLTDESCRLLTLLGPGGIGKTRLSIESISRLSTKQFEHGVFYVPLAPLNSTDNIVTTVISVLGIMIGDDGTSQEELVKFLSGRNLLLVMDNFEHVLDGADLVAEILNSAYDVKILATSREALNLQQEWVWHVRGMRYPDGTTIDDIEKYSALKLFLDRAKRIRREFSPIDNQACAIRICQLVGGMPLAIELSASWLKTLSCNDIVDEIEHGIDFLSTRTRNIPERHRSIRAVFDHSWSLLSTDEQAVFPRLSVFRGGFTRDVAQKVAAADLMTLSGLVEKTMVRRDSSGRYEVHELLRQYAEEKLQLADDFDEIESEHMTYFADFMTERAIDIKGRNQIQGLDAVETDFYNVRKAWDMALNTINFSVLDKMIEGLALYCDMRALYIMGENIFHEAVTKLNLHKQRDLHRYNRLTTRYIQVWLLQEIKPIPTKMVELNEQCYEIARDGRDEFSIMLCLFMRGEFYRLNREYHLSIEANQESQALANHLHEPYYVGRSLRITDYMLVSRFNPSLDRQNQLEIRHLHQETLSEINDINGLAHAIHYMATDRVHVRKFEDAEKYNTIALENWQRIGDRKSIAVATSLSGFVSFYLGNFDQASFELNTAVQQLDESNYIGTMSANLIFVSILELFQGDHRKSKVTYQRALERLSSSYRSKDWSLIYETLLAITSKDYDLVRQNLAILSMSAWYVFKSMTLEMMPFVFHHDQEWDKAVQLLAWGFANIEYYARWIQDWELFEQMQADLKIQLGESAYQTVWNENTNQDFDSIVAGILAYLSDETSTIVSLKSQPLTEPLTERELEVLALIAEGLTNPQIADKLYLSTGTVKVHTRNIYGKLNVSNRTEASTVARKLNLI